MTTKRKRDTRCIDCGYQTQPRKPKRDYEQYIVRDAIWRAAGMPLGKVDPKTFVLSGGGGCLCVDCIETRLDRKLRLSDFSPRTTWLLLQQCCNGWQSPRLSEAVFRFRRPKVRRPPKGKEIILRLVGSGNLFGGCFAITETVDGHRRAQEIRPLIMEDARGRRE
jgi:hypothetical protein